VCREHFGKHTPEAEDVCCAARARGFLPRLQRPERSRGAASRRSAVAGGRELERPTDDRSVQVGLARGAPRPRRPAASSESPRESGIPALGVRGSRAAALSCWNDWPLRDLDCPKPPVRSRPAAEIQVGALSALSPAYRMIAAAAAREPRRRQALIRTSVPSPA